MPLPEPRLTVTLDAGQREAMNALVVPLLGSDEIIKYVLRSVNDDRLRDRMLAGWLLDQGIAAVRERLDA